MEFKEKQAIYLQIAEYFYENILLNRWKPGDRIPSVRELAISTEVNPNTVMRTFTYLQDKGIIFNKRGIGYFVSDNAVDLTKSTKKEIFINTELPEFFKTMELLKVDFKDLQKLYNKFSNKK